MNIIIGAKPPLLEFVGTIIVPKTTCKFSVKNKIVSNKKAFKFFLKCVNLPIIGKAYDFIYSYEKQRKLF